MNRHDIFRQGLGFAMRIGVEIVLATGIGTLMGYFLDQWLESEPWFLALGVVFGGASGVLNVYRASKVLTSEVETEEDNKDNKEPEETSEGSGKDDLKF